MFQQRTKHLAETDTMTTTQILTTAALWLDLISDDETATFDEVDDRAEALQHTDPATRSAWIKVRVATRWLAEDDGSNDKFGFRAEKRASCEAVVALYNRAS